MTVNVFPAIVKVPVSGFWALFGETVYVTGFVALVIWIQLALDTADQFPALVTLIEQLLYAAVHGEGLPVEGKLCDWGLRTGLREYSPRRFR